MHANANDASASFSDADDLDADDVDADGLDADGLDADGLDTVSDSAHAAALKFPVSGLYAHTWESTPLDLSSVAGDGSSTADWAAAGNVVGGALARPLYHLAELRLDVDGNFAQMTASGTWYSRLTTETHWIASLTATETGWTGEIWFKDSTLSFPYTTVTIRVVRRGPRLRPAAMIVTFHGVRVPLTHTYTWLSNRFRTVEFEYDSTSDAHPVTEVQTHAHPNRPAGLANETLSIDTVYGRAGFAVTTSGGNGSVPLADAGTNTTWSDAEMHDAMQDYWSRFSDAPQWSMWVFSAALHDMGPSLGGIMFDDIGPNHRQGTAIFSEAFISNAPAGDAAPDAWVQRMRFWTTTHEMGHAFNLAHSWQKSLGTAWIPLLDEPEARSFMNYPDKVAGAEKAFFATFDYRFSNAELLFMRHAPARFVQMGNASWFDHHGFESPNAALPASQYRLQVRANRQKTVFDFLEPVVLEVKLTNEGRDPKIVGSTTLAPQGLVVIIKPQGKQARQWAPYATSCLEPRAEVLASGSSTYETLPLFAGLNGWDVAEPGIYDIHVAAEVEGTVVFSSPLRLRVAAPQSSEEESLAADFFTEDVGRTLAFSGTVSLAGANDTLRETVDRLPHSSAAIHAAIALAQPLARDFKTLTIPHTEALMSSVSDSEGSVAVRSAEPAEALALLSTAMGDTRGAAAAQSLGHVGYRREVELFADALSHAGDAAGAASMQTDLAQVLADRGVLATVVQSIEDKASAFAAPKTRAGRRPKESGVTL